MSVKLLNWMKMTTPFSSHQRSLAVSFGATDSPMFGGVLRAVSGLHLFTFLVPSTLLNWGHIASLT